MSVDPTPYDLEQDTRISTIEGFVDPDYGIPEGNEYSYPVVGQPMSDSMWAHLAKAWGSGVISYGGAPYRRGAVNDVDNTITIYAADDEGRESGAVLEGFAHRMEGNVVLEVPAVTTATDYVIGLQYDPTRQGNPIKLGTFTRPLDTSQNRKYIPIWEGRRNPSSVLSSVTWNTARSRIAPTTTVARQKYLPDPRHSGLMWGTLCWTYWDRKWFQLRWANEEGGEMVWVDITDPQWTNPGDGDKYVWPGHGYRRGWRQIGDVIEFRGRIGRKGGAAFAVGGGDSGFGYHLYNFGTEDAPAREQRFITASSGTTSQRMAVITVTTDGNVYGMPIDGSAAWMSLDGIRVNLKE